ncbi:MAG: YqaJ viral recombinase family protein [Paludibacter sp.]|nr:YqaJ viral recombinase family protein [Paludibacter sp.]
MKTLEVWTSDRLGLFTASRISDLLICAKGDKDGFGVVAMSYIMEKVCEILTGEQKPEVNTKSIEWGNENEAVAMAVYSRNTNKKVAYFGKENPKSFSLAPDYNLSGSPDGLIFDEKVIEIKCPYNSVNHIENTLMNLEAFKKERKEYYAQIQVNMLVTDTNICDFVSFDPRMIDEKLQLSILEVPKDSEFQKLILQRVEAATEILRDTVKKINTKIFNQ